MHVWQHVANTLNDLIIAIVLYSVYLSRGNQVAMDYLILAKLIF